MKGIVASTLIVLNCAFVLLIFWMMLSGIRQRGEKIDVGMWFFIITIGIPAAFVMAATLLGY